MKILHYFVVLTAVLSVASVTHAQTAQNSQSTHLFYNNTGFAGIDACFFTTDEVADDTPFTGVHHVASFTFEYENFGVTAVDAVVNFFTVDPNTGKPGSIMASFPVSSLSPTPASGGPVLRTVNIDPSQQFDWTATPGIYGQQSVTGGFVSIQFSQKAGWCEASGASLDGFIDLTTGQFITFGGDSSASFYLQISEAHIAPALSSLTLKPATIEGDDNSVGTVVISSPAPQGGLIVNLFSDKPSLATVPRAITVAAGKTRASFVIKTRAVATNTKVIVSASSGGVVKIAKLTLTP